MTTAGAAAATASTMSGMAMPSTVLTGEPVAPVPPTESASTEPTTQNGTTTTTPGNAAAAAAAAAKKQREKRSTKSKCPPGLRSGKWTPEEEAFTNMIIHYFKRGLLNIEDGTSLRWFLAKRLNCEAMRVTKKLKGNSSIGKQIFRALENTPENRAAIEQAAIELAAVEKNFVDSLTPSAAAGAAASAAASGDASSRKKSSPRKAPAPPKQTVNKSKPATSDDDASLLLHFFFEANGSPKSSSSEKKRLFSELESLSAVAVSNSALAQPPVASEELVARPAKRPIVSMAQFLMN
ncbi:TPA: hypothetical protein N0F65_010326 [Lagenidium giganteum]|uniref:Uncharacterized protein n=1 Tax=Lagenidium giganteum TaxID=4803 RepID=A0AAV2Z7E4_9STRA|nr:TPA: hypothetical protein N0F65_010326 [Lagenidium giganteum]